MRPHKQVSMLTSFFAIFMRVTLLLGFHTNADDSYICPLTACMQVYMLFGEGNEQHTTRGWGGKLLYLLGLHTCSARCAFVAVAVFFASVLRHRSFHFTSITAVACLLSKPLPYSYRRRWPAYYPFTSINRGTLMWPTSYDLFVALLRSILSSS